MQMRTDAYPGHRRPSGPPQHKDRDRKPQVVRTTRAVNLGKLAEACDLDVLSAALGVNEHSLRALIDGREQFKDSPHGMHVSVRLGEAGVNPSWLENATSKVDPTQISEIRKLAARSDRKAPIRKSNFKKLAAAFEGRKQLLADALEVVEASIDNILAGRNELDDERFWHLNPRLMDAGFPNRWLEDPNAELTEDLIEGLEEIAADDIERFFDDEDDDHSPAPVVVAPLKSAVSPSVPAQLPLQETAAEPTNVPTQAAPEPLPANPKSTVKETTMATSNSNVEQKQAVTLPRGALAAGRRIGGGAPVASKPVQVVSAPSTETASVGAPTLVPNKMPTLHAHPKTEPVAMPEVQSPVAGIQEGQQGGVNVVVKKRRTLEKPQPQVAPAAAATTVAESEATPAPKRKGRPVSISKEKSFARFKVLDDMLSSLPRGAKTEFWSKMGRSLQYAGNIRTGATMFRDELAHQAEETLGVEKGWLDNPTPVKQFSPWLTEFIQNAGGAATPAPLEATQAPAEPAAPTVAEPATAPMPAKQEVAAPAAEQAPAPVAPVAEPVKAASVKPFARTAAKPTVDVQYPVQEAPEAAASSAATSAFTWAPAEDSAANVNSGPMTQALCAVLNQLSKDGKFTEQDAMRMIQFLLAR